MGDAEKPCAFDFWRFWGGAFREVDEGFLENVFDVVFVKQDAVEVSEHAGRMFVVKALEGFRGHQSERSQGMDVREGRVCVGRVRFFEEGISMILQK